MDIYGVLMLLILLIGNAKLSAGNIIENQMNMRFRGYAKSAAVFTLVPLLSAPLQRLDPSR